MKPDPTFDRRRFPRLQTESLVSIAKLDTDTALAHALDLSIGGVRFRCVGLEASPGDVLKVTFTFGERSVAVIGRILRVEALDDVAQEIALNFLKMSAETRRVLQENLPVDDLYDPSDRRSMARVQLGSIVAVSVASLADVVAQARNLSAGGVHFVVEGLELQLGDVLRVTFECDGAPVTAIGQLVRVTHIDDFKQEAALVFLEVQAEDRERLERTLGALLP